MILIVPPFHRIPPEATLQDRERMLEEWKAELIRCNPHLYKPDGSTRSLLGWVAYLFGKRDG